MRIKMTTDGKCLCHVRIKFSNGGGSVFDKPLMNHTFPQLHCFDIILSTLFLCTLQKPPKISVGGQLRLEISEEDVTLFKIIKRKQEDIVKASKAYQKCKKSSETGEDGEEDFV